ncbi:MAG: DoxX family protein [Xanthobacter sp.]
MSLCQRVLKGDVPARPDDSFQHPSSAQGFFMDMRTGPYSLFILRVSLGLMWVCHALMKLFIFMVPGFAGFLESQGLPGVLAVPVIAAECLGGLALIGGIYVRPVAMLLIPVMAGAMSVHIPNGWVFSAAGGRWEYPAFLIASSLVVELTDEGAFALKPSPLAPFRLVVAQRHSA